MSQINIRNDKIIRKTERTEKEKKTKIQTIKNIK